MDKDVLDIYTDYLISQTKYATATKLSDILDQEVSHDKITRFLSKPYLTSLEFWKYIKPLVRKHNSESEVLCLDDTISEKPSTDENDIVCWHHSHAKGVHVKGINIVSCILSTSNLSIPIDYEIVKKYKRYYDEKDKRYKRRSKITKNQMFQNMINRAVINQVKFKYILRSTIIS
ncbi:transposase [Francisella tularensis]|uniref:transposase n=1 Tax=Francisella tularensis TaxID=263 RepID=UPI0013660775|nr:transposase [Francisella tularensis]MWZ89305.1 transposase [Francisella tularensis]